MLIKQRGHVLWLIVIILGSLAQLAIITIQQAAASGVSVRRIEAYWQREILVEHIALHLQGMPLLRLSSADQQELWHPVAAPVRNGCASELKQSFLVNSCDAKVRWRWQLVRDATAMESWPGVLTQRYRLSIEAFSASGSHSQWQYDYEQRSLP